MLVKNDTSNHTHTHTHTCERRNASKEAERVGYSLTHSLSLSVIMQ